MPHPIQERRTWKGGTLQVPQYIIDDVHELAEVGGTTKEIIVDIAKKHDGYVISSGSVRKYAKAARKQIRKVKLVGSKAKRIVELFNTGISAIQIDKAMHKEGYKISTQFISSHLKDLKLIPEVNKRWVNRRKREAEMVQPEVREHPSMEEATVEVVSLDELLQGFNVNQEVNDIKVTSELETMEINQVTMVQVYQDALNQIDEIIRPSIVKGLQAALQLQATDSVLEELKFLRSAMEIPNSILESQRADQETTIQQVANNQSQAVMKALYQEQQAKRDVELQRQAYANANAGEGSLNQRD